MHIASSSKQTDKHSLTTQADAHKPSKHPPEHPHSAIIIFRIESQCVLLLNHWSKMLTNRSFPLAASVLSMLALSSTLPLTIQCSAQNPLTSSLTQTGLLTSTYRTPVNVAITNLTLNTLSPTTNLVVEQSFTAPADYLPAATASSIGTTLDLQFILFANRPYATAQADTPQTGFTGGALYLDYVSPQTQQSITGLQFDTQGTQTPYVTFKSLRCPTEACAYLCVRWDSLNQAYTIAGVAPPPQFAPATGQLNCAVSSTPALITAQYISITPPPVVTPVTPPVTTTPIDAPTGGQVTPQSGASSSSDSITGLPSASVDTSSSSMSSTAFASSNSTSFNDTSSFSSSTGAESGNSTLNFNSSSSSSSSSSSTGANNATSVPITSATVFSAYGLDVTRRQLNGGFIFLIVLACLIACVVIPCCVHRHHKRSLDERDAANRAQLASKYIGGQTAEQLRQMESGQQGAAVTAATAATMKSNSTGDILPTTQAHSQEASQVQPGTLGANGIDESTAYTYVQDYKSLMGINQQQQQQQFDQQQQQQLGQSMHHHPQSRRTLGSDAHNVLFVMNE